MISPLFFFIISSQSIQSGAYFLKREEVIRKQMKPEHQQQALEELKRLKVLEEYSKNKYFPILVFVGLTPLWVLGFFPIYFFTRPKVKEQFK